MKKIFLLFSFAFVFVWATSCGNGDSDERNTIDTAKTTCDLYLDLGFDSNGTYLIADSDLYCHLDSVCSLLNKANPENSKEYYRDILIAERSKEKPTRCLLIERDIPYNIWQKVIDQPGWRRCVIKYIDDKSVIHYIGKDNKKTKKQEVWLSPNNNHEETVKQLKSIRL